MGIEEQFPGVDVYDVLNFDRRKTCLETVLHTLLICESQRSLLSMVIPKRRCSDTSDQFSPRLERDRVVRVTTGVSVW